MPVNKKVLNLSELEEMNDEKLKDDNKIELRDHYHPLFAPSYPVDEELMKYAAMNPVFQQIEQENYIGMKSIKCACGKRTALVEKNPRDVKDVFTLIDTRWVSQSKQNTHMIKKDYESHGLLYRDARVSSGKLIMSRSMSD